MKSLEDVLRGNREKIGNIVFLDLNGENSVVFDFTANNKELAKVDMSNIEQFDNFIQTALKRNGGRVGIGKYNEDRMIYRHSSLFGISESESRTIHLGTDIFLPAGTKICAPLDSEIHSFQNNKGLGNYGPTIILQHELDGIIFYTLYGHLSEESLYEKSEGQRIEKGGIFAEIGNKEVNGSWPEHVHFEIIKDMLGRKGDFPGVASIRERDKYLKICPNPNLILKIDKLNEIN